MESSDWTENQKGLIKYYDPERYEKIWGKVKAVITEVEPEVKEPEPEVKEPEPETKKEEESAAE
jgi:hypothetical protein